MTTDAKSGKISRDDIESKLRALQGDVQQKVDDRKGAITAAVGVAATIVVVVVFLLGRRSGRRKSAVVEIRRF